MLQESRSSASHLHRRKSIPGKAGCFDVRKGSHAVSQSQYLTLQNHVFHEPKNEQKKCSLFINFTA